MAGAGSEVDGVIVIPGWSEGPDLRCAIAHRGISRFRVRCFASPRNDDTHIRLLAAQSAPELCLKISSSLIEEGAGNAGCPMHPQPGVRWGSEVCTPVFTAEAPETSGIPHAMVLRLIRDLPGDEFLLPPSPRGLHGISYPGWAACASARLDINNGCQDHTTSPYATT